MKDPLGVHPMEIPAMITFPTVKDRGTDRTGSEEDARESCQVLCLARTEWFGQIPEPETGTITTNAWQHPVRSVEYGDLKDKWVNRLRQLLLTVYPQLEGKIDMFDHRLPHRGPTTSHTFLPQVGVAVGGQLGPQVPQQGWSHQVIV